MTDFMRITIRKGPFFSEKYTKLHTTFAKNFQDFTDSPEWPWDNNVPFNALGYIFAFSEFLLTCTFAIYTGLNVSSHIIIAIIIYGK